jgi:hypothetical protein
VFQIDFTGDHMTRPCVASALVPSIRQTPLRITVCPINLTAEIKGWLAHVTERQTCTIYCAWLKRRVRLQASPFHSQVKFANYDQIDLD